MIIANLHPMRIHPIPGKTNAPLVIYTNTSILIGETPNHPSKQLPSPKTVNPQNYKNQIFVTPQADGILPPSYARIRCPRVNSTNHHSPT